MTVIQQHLLGAFALVALAAVTCGALGSTSARRLATGSLALATLATGTWVFQSGAATALAIHDLHHVSHPAVATHTQAAQSSAWIGTVALAALALGAANRSPTLRRPLWATAILLALVGWAALGTTVTSGLAIRHAEMGLRVDDVTSNPTTP